MIHTPRNLSHPAFEYMSLSEASVLLNQARALQRAAQAGVTQTPLKGKNLGLLCEDADSADALLFQHAATELGAHVSHIRSSLSEASTAQDVAHTAHLLGRLYDAVECQGMSHALVRRISEAVDMPVYRGLASARHPTARLAEQLDGGSRSIENRHYVLQAALLNKMT